MSANLMSLARSGGKFLKLFGDRKMVRTLPYLRRVAYLEYDGNQYIDTLVVPTQGYSFGASVLNITAGEPSKYGINGAKGPNSRFAFGLGPGGRYGKYFGLSQVNDDTYSSLVLNEWIDWALDSASKIGTAGSEMVNILNANALDANGKSIYLMLSNPINNNDRHKGRCRNAWIKDQNGDYVFNAIPVLDLSGRPAMYDDVSGQFFYNQGTGEFTWGELDSQTT